MAKQSDDYDSPWKEALERYLRSFLELCFPDVAAAIDWNRRITFLDKELQEIVRDAALGEQRVDKLVQVWLLDGSEEWILLHLEVQHRHDVDLPRRVYQYHHRIGDRYGKRVVSLVILADEREDWRPAFFQEEILGCRVRFDFPVCKLLDLTRAGHRLAESRQPSAVVVLANWAAQRTRREMGERKLWKWDLTRRLYEMGFEKQDILELYRVIDWLLRLPEALEKEFRNELHRYEQENAMPYVTSIERLGREEGRKEGRVEGRMEAARDMLRDTLEVRFGPPPLFVQEKIASEKSMDQLKIWHRLALTSSTFEAFQNGISAR